MAGASNTSSNFLRRALPIVVEIAVNFLIPLVVYDKTVAQLGEVGALIASSAAPLVWSLIEFARHRRLDAISLLALLGIVLSLLLYLGGGSAHVLQLREKLVTAIIGVVFLVSVLFNRPLIYELSRASMKRDPKQADALAALEARAEDPRMKAVMRTLTLGWGFGLIFDAGVSVWLVMHLSVRDYLLYGPPAGYGVIGLLILWTVLYVRRAQAKGRARRAAEAAAAQASSESGA